MSFKSNEEKLLYVQNHVRNYPDFPKPGVLFRDIFSAIAHGPVCKILKELIIDHVATHFPGIEAVIGLESKGFLFAFSIAAELGISCLVARKKGKLPGNVKSISYSLEYGTDVFEVQSDVLKKGLRVLVIDDLLATGGSLRAVAELLKSAECNVAGCLVVFELVQLCGRNNLPDDVPVHSIIKYNSES